MIKIYFTVVFTVATLMGSLVFSKEPSFMGSHFHALPLDLTGEELQRIFKAPKRVMATEPLDAIVLVGKKNMEWLRIINQQRPPHQKLSFTSAETQLAYPLEAPNVYNEQIILSKYRNLVQELPIAIKNVLINGASMTPHLPLPEKEYVYWGLLVDRVYQSTTRWMMYQPYLSYLIQNRMRDIRGYYFLSRIENRTDILKNYGSLTAEEKSNIRQWLISMCMNNGTGMKVCIKTIDAAMAQSLDLNINYSKYESMARAMYNSYFQIPSHGTRSDIKWKTDGGVSVSVIPFLLPKEADVRDFVKLNVEAEWRLSDWALNLSMVSSSYDTPYIVFEPGATPNVNGLGGNRITMDANQPLSEYGVQWAIRHEFGHVLGFPDCYLEYYDEERGAIVGYQIDTTNLMCSRRGHMTSSMVNEFKKVYLPRRR